MPLAGSPLSDAVRDRRATARPIGALLERLGAAAGGLRLAEDEVPGGVRRYLVSSRLSRANGMVAAAYLVGDILVDSGFVHASPLLLAALAGRPLAAIALTHHHEDHAGAAGPLAAQHGCPVYLRAPERRDEEGVTALRPYRSLWWGRPPPYAPRPLPARLTTPGHVLRAVPIPGHSATHTTLYDETTGVAFIGDLYLTGGATAVMAHEDPYASVASLRRVADLAPRWLLGGHGLTLADAAPALRAKADRIERAAAEVRALNRAGVPERRIAWRLFPRGRINDLRLELMTQGEFSRLNFVRACLRHAPAAAP